LQGRLGKSLELWNNAIIVTPDADINDSYSCFAVGTAGQRCTSTRRLIIHESIYDTKKMLVSATGASEIH
jgi:aldehyde dehydrogenase (NAD+)